MSQAYKNTETDQLEQPSFSIETLPSRKVKHPKPTTFLDKPTFSLIIFILFILLLGGIFIYYLYNAKDNNNNLQPSNESELSKENPVSTIDKKETQKPSTNPKPAESTSPEDQPTYTSPIVDSEPTTDEKVDTEKSEPQQPDVEKPLAITHIVSEKDTLFNIAKKYYGSGESSYILLIKEENGLKDDTIRIGMELLIPNPINTP